MSIQTPVIDVRPETAILFLNEEAASGCQGGRRPEVHVFDLRWGERVGFTLERHGIGSMVQPSMVQAWAQENVPDAVVLAIW